MLKNRQKTAKNKAKARRKLTPRQRFARLRPNERAALLEFVARLREKFPERIQNVILYGSRARGQGDEESDLDVLVVVPNQDNDFRQWVIHESTLLVLEHDALLSPKVWTTDSLERHKRDGLLFYRNLKRDGIELWTTKFYAASKN